MARKNNMRVLIICPSKYRNEYLERIVNKYPEGSVTMLRIGGVIHRCDTGDDHYTFVEPQVNRIQGFTPDRVVVHPLITDPDVLQEARIRVLARNGEYGTEI